MLSLYIASTRKAGFNDSSFNTHVDVASCMWALVPAPDSGERACGSVMLPKAQRGMCSLNWTHTPGKL